MNIRFTYDRAFYILTSAIWTFFDFIALFFTTSPKKKGIKKLLIVRLDAIGDFIIFLDTFKEYKKLFPEPEWEITFAGNALIGDLAAHLPYADYYLFVERKRFQRNPIYRYKILSSIRKTAFDKVIQPTYSREYSFGDAIVRTSGAGERIGNRGDEGNLFSWQKKISAKWYTRLIDAPIKNTNELEYNATFIRQLGLSEFKASPPSYPLEFLPTSFSLKQEITDNYFIVFPGAGWEGRMWSRKNFAAVARYVYEQRGWIPVLCGGPGEETIAEEVMAWEKNIPWRNIAGKLSLSQLVQTIKNARLLIANETSAVHIASSVGCPNVCIMGGGHFSRFYPYGDPEKNRIVYKKMDCYGCNWVCQYTTVRCIEEISIGDVINNFKQIVD